MGTLDVNYVRSESKTKVSYSSVVPKATRTTAVPFANLALAGSGMSDNSFVSNQISAKFLVPLNKQMSVTLLGGYEDGETVDWHYPSNMTSNLIYQTGATVQMDAGPQAYHITTFGMMFNYKM